MKQTRARQIHDRPAELLRSNPVRAFWKASLDPLDSGRAEGDVRITIESPESDHRKREISFRCLTIDDRMMVLGIGKLLETRHEDDEIVQTQSVISYETIPFNIVEFLIDLRNNIESQWEHMQRSVKGRMMKAEGIVVARFKHILTPEEDMRIQAVQTHIIDPESKENDGKPQSRGSVRQLRPSREGSD